MTPDLAALAACGGWDFTETDLCWLDHAGGAPAGFFKTWTDRHGARWQICLCPADGLVLEAGAFGGDYAGAPTPAYSMAAEWPWMAADPAVPEAV